MLIACREKLLDDIHHYILKTIKKTTQILNKIKLN